MKAVIFAGGRGTRFSEKTQYMPKPMIEIGGFQKGLINIELCRNKV